MKKTFELTFPVKPLRFARKGDPAGQVGRLRCLLWASSVLVRRESQTKKKEGTGGASGTDELSVAETSG